MKRTQAMKLTQAMEGLFENLIENDDINIFHTEDLRKDLYM